jgi:hypothetical protein
MSNIWNGRTTPPWETSPIEEADPRAQDVEDYADNLLADCMDLAKAKAINFDNDLYDGDFPPKMMQAIANWTGSTESAVKQMRVLHNLLADELQKIAEREVK